MEGAFVFVLPNDLVIEQILPKLLYSISPNFERRETSFWDLDYDVKIDKWDKLKDFRNLRIINEAW
jgi:hypothetical protein